MVFFRERVSGLLSLNARDSARCSAVEGRRFVSLVLVLVASFLTNLVVAAEDFARPPAQPLALCCREPRPRGGRHRRRYRRQSVGAVATHMPS